MTGPAMTTAPPPASAPTPAPSVTSIEEAVAAAAAGLGYLAGLNAATVLAADLGGGLRALEALHSAHVAAHATLLGGFTAQRGFENDGQGTPGSWLRWQTRITKTAATRAVGWMKTLSAHPLVRAALTAGEISESWARPLCAWSDALPEDQRQDADKILLAAADGGADLADLSGLAEEMARRCARPDEDDDDGFKDRGVRLAVTYQGAGRLEGDLTPECTAGLRAVLDSLGKKAGPEDDRTQEQREHDALEEAVRLLIGAGGLPDVAGQPVQAQVHITLDQLRSLNGAADAEAAWAAGRAAADDLPGWVRSRATAEAYSCDAQLVPVVSGHLDPAALAAMTADYLAATGRGDLAPLPACPAGPGCPHAGRSGGQAPAATGPAAARTRKRLQDTLLRYAGDVLSGPAGLAAYLRTGLLPGQLAHVSLPLDTGKPTHTVPPYLRNLLAARDRHCAFPGCRRRPSHCQAHHLIPWSQGGPTALWNLALLCSFHHLIVLHRWGWSLALNGDGTTTATSPDGKVLHSHGPPDASDG